MKNSVFIATSLDGFIADKDGGIDWLDSIPEINQIDTGYVSFTTNIDALLMGRNTFEKVCSFDIDWPYKMPVFVLSNSIDKVPPALKDVVFLLKGTPTEVLKAIHKRGHKSLYVDGGKLIQSFLKEDLIDEMVITIIPILLGSGFPLFAEQANSLNFECVETKLFLDKVVQNRFVRRR